MSEEKLSFSINLSATYWHRRPQFSIWLDDRVIQQSEIAGQGIQQISFDRIVSQGPHTLKIRLENKTDNDTVIENGKVVKDMLLNIEDVTIDDISLGTLLWSAEYVLDKPQKYQGKIIDHLDGCVNLGWNGTYILKFTSPYYLWLVRKF